MKILAIIVSVFLGAVAVLGDDDSKPFIPKDYPCIIPSNYRGKIEFGVSGDQYQMYVFGGRYMNTWAMFPDEYKSWEKAGEPQPFTPEYTAWCKAHPPRYRR